MYRGLIVDVKQDYITVVTKNMGMKKVNVKNGSKIGEEIYFTRDDIHKAGKKISWRYMTIAAMILIVIAASGIGYAMQNMVYTVISLDINPSVQIEVNRNDKVIGLEAMNEDAENIITEDMIGQDIEKVLEQLVDNSINGGYLKNEEGILYITTVEKRNDNDDIDELLLQLIEDEHSNYSDFIVVLAQGTTEDLEEAEESNVTVGVRLLERARDNVSETGQTNRNEVMSVREFFNSMDNVDAFLKDNGTVVMNKERMKEAIQMHKDAIEQEQEDRKDEKEGQKEEKEQNKETNGDADEPEEDEDEGKPENPGKSNEDHGKNDIEESDED